MPRLNSLLVMSDVIKDASLRLAAIIGSSSRKSLLTFFVGASAACLLLVGCAGSDGQKDDTDIWSETKLYSEANEKLKDADYAKCGKYFEKLEARFPFGPYSQQAQINTHVEELQILSSQLSHIQDLQHLQ
jgi:outer membrane protein assembly factor BamD